MSSGHAQSGKAGSEAPGLAEAFDELASRLQAGEAVGREEVRRRYPAHAEELLRLLPALAALGELSAPGSAGPAGADGRDGGPAPQVLGDFRILRELGRGGMGVVYEAEQVSLGRKVALKVLPAAATLDPRRLQRFHNEARAAASLHHANIVPVFAVGSEHGVHFYAMLRIEGPTLAAVLRDLRGKAAPAAAAPGGEVTTAHPEQPSASAEAPSTAAQAALSTEGGVASKEYVRSVARLGAQAAEALDYAHQLGVVHRDVKPGNLMVDGRGQLWVTDFGLAQFKDGEASLTLTGDLMGTLRYMSPEQALAKRVPIDHRTDVYSLGATLYELLTLRPVFGGTSREELLRQIAFEEPRPPRKVNRAIPAELETIVLKALEKNPADRYATAQDLADDLERFLEDRPIQARRPSLVQRARKWARRHRALVGAASAVLAVAALLGAGSWLWWAQKRAAAEDEARAALRDAAALLDQERWPEALSAARRAEGVLAGLGADPALCRQARTLIDDLGMAQRLQEARLQAASVKDNDPDFGAAEAAYAAAFGTYGLDVDGFDPREAVERIGARAIGRQLVAALDDWAYIRKELKRGGWRHRLAVARAADPDERRNRLREALVRKDARALEDAATADRADEWPTQSLVLLGGLARGTATGKRVAALLARVQQQHPGDFWLNNTLGVLLLEGKPPRLEEAIRFLSVAVALRPQSPGAHNNLGNALADKGRLDEAVAEYTEALRLKKDYPMAHINLGNALKAKGLLDQAIGQYRAALRLRKDFPEAHNHLGIALKAKGRLDQAIAAYRAALRLRKDFPEAHNHLGAALADSGRLDEAIAAYREALRLKREYPVAHYNLGAALLGKGRPDDAIAEWREALRLKKDYPTAHNNLGGALLGKGRPDEAIAEFREAIRLKKDFPMAHNNLGAALAGKGRLDEAIAEFREAVRLKPDFPGAHANLSRALSEKGLTDQARAKQSPVEQGPGQLAEILRGDLRPVDAGERGEFARLCQAHGYNAAAARLCQEGFDDLGGPARYLAACAAALAGTGQGKDADTLGEKERARWRGQALAWLRPELAAMKPKLEKDPHRWHGPVHKELQAWQADPRLAGVRDAAALARLPGAERQQWQALWQEVEALRQRAGAPPGAATRPGP
jgi:serine/threonine protein kinase/Flp pilus assembly protein TadD